MMNTFEVVISQVPIQFPLHLGHAGKEPSSEGHSPKFSKDGSLQPFHKPVGPSMPWFGPGVSDVPGSTRFVELSVILPAAVRQDPLNLKPLLTKSGDHRFPKESRRLFGRPVSCDQSRDTKGGGRHGCRYAS